MGNLYICSQKHKGKMDKTLFFIKMVEKVGYRRLLYFLHGMTTMGVMHSGKQCEIEDPTFKITHGDVVHPCVRYFDEPFEGGGEAVVYLADGGTNVVKSIHLGYYDNDPQLALDRILIHNYLFPNTALTDIGFGRDSDGTFKIFVSQPYIKGKAAKREEIIQYAKDRGFTTTDNNVYYYDGIRINDLNELNVIKTQDGAFAVIDAELRFSTDNSSQVFANNSITGDATDIIDVLNNIRESVTSSGLTSGMSLRWNQIRDKVLSIRENTQIGVWRQLAGIIPNKIWRNLTEQQRRDLADAVVSYNNPTVFSRAASSTDPEPLTDQSNGNAIGLGALRHSLEDAIFTEFVNANEAAGNIMMAEDKENLRRHLQGLNDQDIMDTINAIRRACRDGNGVLMLSADGELMEGC